MALKFLYIDDEPEKTARGLITKLDDKVNIDFTIVQPLTWNQQKSKLIDKGGLNEFDGLLLDFKLQFSDDEDSEIKYSGAELAQSVRNGSKSGAIKDIPIFLCSTEDFYINLFDRTSKDLFDVKYKKEINLNTEDTQSEMIAFAEAYSTISSNHKELETILQKPIYANEDIEILKTELNCFQTPHEWVYLINNYCIQSAGLLIDENLLAIRLGIDRIKSKKWDILKNEFLLKCRYEGILSGFYSRWWQFELNNWWYENFDKSLIVLNADERVNFLNEKFGLDLVAIQSAEHQQYSTFWYKCRLSDIALDSTDGLRTIEMPRYVWQEPTYISLSYLLSDERDIELAYSLLGPNERQIFEELDDQS
ncbi:MULTISPECIES: hypothetical protein [unclassified Sphingobacterium]|uniref:hypothetical protein n=1 Tax=unclassified Sphingobacterium TaxID=2609468 RepID=UPI00260142D7|nr:MULTISPECIES: hypothetical protein [unclassified Sphingobacterium]